MGGGTCSRDVRSVARGIRGRLALGAAALAAIAGGGGILALAAPVGAATHKPAASVSTTSATSAPPSVVTPAGHRPLGIVKAVTPGSKVPAAPLGNAAGKTSFPCNTAVLGAGCQPPLNYKGGPVMGTTSTVGKNTVYAIYWDPTASKYPYATRYKSIVNGYLANVAASDGTTGNVYAAQQQYYETATLKKHLHYQVVFGGSITVTTAFPTTGNCRASGIDKICLTDAQEQAEVTKIIAARGDPAGLAHFYMVFFPRYVETCFVATRTCSAGATTSVAAYCGYHSGVKDGAATLLYANMPYPYVPECHAGSLESPNGTTEADTTISITSHENIETITDPLGNAWTTTPTGYEIGDECAYQYGTALGGSAGSQYNQAVNGGHYWTQLEFSNEDYRATGNTNGCIASDDPPTASFTATATVLAGSTATVTGGASSDPDSSTPLAYSWDWGDASAHGTGKTATHAYSSPGAYTITLTVTTGDGWTNTATKQITVLPASKPGTPAGVKATPGNGLVKVGWNAVAGAASYKVYDATTSNGETYNAAAACTSKAPSCTVTGLTNGTTYFFTVEAVNAAGHSTPSTEVTAKPAFVPPVPTGVKATPATGKVTVSWNASNGATSYQVYDATASGGESYTGAAACTTSSTSCTVTGLPDGTTEYFTVEALNATGHSGPTIQVTATPTAAPAAPTGVSATPGTSKVTVRWSTTAGATSYKVFKATGSGAETYAGPPACTATAPATTCTASGLVNGTRYFFTVEALDTGGASPPSTEVTATPLTVPGAPTGVTATAGTQRVTVGWTAQGGATSYAVYDATKSGGEKYTSAPACTVTAPTRSCQVTGLKNGTTYYFTVEAANAAGHSGPSSQVSAKPAAPPAPPSSVTATPKIKKVTVSWSAVSGATGYAVYDGTSSGGESYTAPACSVSSVVRTCTVGGLTPGVTYYFTVESVRSGVHSVPSVERSAVPKA